MDKRYRERVFMALVSLAADPLLGKALDGRYAGQRSYRVWPYRIIYTIHKSNLIVEVIRIGHRQSVY